MLGPKEVKEVRKVPLSADTIKRRIDDMSNDILETLIKKIKASSKFCIQIDETTDISKKAQLLSVIRFAQGADKVLGQNIILNLITHTVEY